MEWIRREWAAVSGDIHFERVGDELQVRARRHGTLAVIARLHGEEAHAATRLLRVRAGISTSESYLPAEGRLAIAGAGPQAAMRMGLLSTCSGESIVLRPLDGSGSTITIADLGIPPHIRNHIDNWFHRGGGMLLCTGPTGAGKSTTAACLLKHMLPANCKLITIEDPVETDLPDAFQSNVNEAAGWTFATALRAFLRHDPDVLFVGEIRDSETAFAAANAALTGHAVIATLHATSTADALQRLHDWQLPNGLIAETTHIIINQRLEADPTTARLHARLSFWLHDEPDEP
jgi:type II secretory ATPase GspE/PulE/Tfp pilus assembly ATPase PilB-like protein